MPLDSPQLSGTESDGAPSSDYCMYCYRNGTFTNPNLTMEGMKTVMRTEMQKRNLGAALIEKTLRELPGLKRWKKHLQFD